MTKKNSVFIASSIDGYIADKNGGLDWLHAIPNPERDDMGYLAFNKDIDALVMGRSTFETVLAFDMDWPYTKPVFVLSHSLKEIPEAYQGKAFLVKGTLTEILEHIHKQGYYKLYIDGGITISNFLKEDLIHEMIITTIPIVLGGGFRLFSEFPDRLEFELVSSKTFLGQITQNHYKRKS
ncbi:dihydrofolate reductase family protein [Poritiphilus flavus]|uniref:Dihydrofolate reductase n=1 Tax=Poritiphilus flavus TaxID=2697053 RepID=A0A6L9EGI2_9FLAO|nr:dihydrofolate reductase family protein [Poritiphilus flavus]NAS13890.1 dihydrofolate reductase [Poritiphilus flavus]